MTDTGKSIIIQPTLRATHLPFTTLPPQIPLNLTILSLYLLAPRLLILEEFLPWAFLFYIFSLYSFQK